MSAAVALVAFPAAVGSRTPSRAPAVEEAAFQAVILDATSGASTLSVDPPDPAYRSAGGDAAQGPYAIGGPPVAAATRPPLAQPQPAPQIAYKPARAVLHGIATFYDNGTTAMRLPRGTVIRVCGPAGCLERVVSDYGPFGPGRIIDLYRPDFFRICGCGWWAGTVWVTVYVY